MSEVLPWVLGAAALGFGGTTAAAAALWRSAVQRTRFLQELADGRERQLDEIRGQLKAQSEHNCELTTAAETAEERWRGALAAAQRAENAQARAEARYASAETVRLEQEQGLLEAETRRKRAEQQLAELRGEARVLAVQSRRTRQLLSALGVTMPEQTRDPVATDRRAITREAIQQLLVDCGATAAALVNDDGLAMFGAGADAGVDRIAATAAWLAEAEAGFAEVLCAPVDSWSVMDRRMCTHFVRVQGSERMLGVENLGYAPLFALRHAHLRMVELPAPGSPVPVAADAVIDLDDAPDEALGRKLTDWARRWGLDAATVLDVEGRPRAATAAAQPGPVMALRRMLRPAFQRFLRDGRFLDDVVIVARAADGATMTFQVLGEDLEAPTLACIGPVQAPDNALEEIAGTIRWHLSATHPIDLEEAS